MIDRHIFAAGMGVLTGAFSRPPLDAATSLMYYDVLSARLTTEQFEQAMKQTLASERFWPTPAVILHHAGVVEHAAPAALQLAGADAFAELLSLGTYTPEGKVFDHGVVERRLGAPGVRALRAIGGTARLREMTEREEVFVRKEFATAYATALTVPAEAMPLLGTVDPRVAKLMKDTGAALAAPPRRRALHAGQRTADVAP